MPIKTVIVGCGNIAESYAKYLTSYPEVELCGFSDLDPARAESFAGKFGGRSYRNLDEVLADSSVQLVVNLTIHHAHEEVIERCLKAGKHVHTEKPLALSYAGAQKLENLASDLGLRLSSAPITWMGESQQAFARTLQKGKTGEIRLVYAEINHGRIETWHPNPAPFYDVGVVWDVGIYPITFLTAFLGPVRRVSALERFLLRERVTLDKKSFTPGRPDLVVAMLDFECGAVARLSCKFYTNSSKQGSAVEFHGDLGSLRIESSYLFNASIQSCVYGEELTPIPVEAKGIEGIEFGRGVQEIARALLEGRPHRATAAHATHVIEIMEAIDRSASGSGALQSIHSTFTPPPTMDS